MRKALPLLCAALTLRAADTAPSLRGYSPSSASTELGWERKLRDIPDADHLRENMRRLSARPHHVGSPYDKDNAEWIAAQLKSYGFETQIETFSVLFPTPKERLLEMLEPSRYHAKLEEVALPEDPTSNQKSEQLPTYNAYSIDGDVTAPIVYVNYGTPADYKELEHMGIHVNGAIVLARYGESWRGIKPKLAAEHGAVACLIYSDPHEDGYFKGDGYPKGAMRPSFGVQRGSVLDIPVASGDPLTPGYGATESAERINLKDVKVLTKIPVMPISYQDAEPFLRALEGPTAPAAWRGSLPLSYHVGPGPAKAHFKVAFHWDRKPLYDVVAKIPGAAVPDEWVIRGNHHDAWVNGADDPISGTSPELEEARSFGELLKAGWKPRRTIVYCFWDGEEPGLLGSTEWVETHAEELRTKAAVYVNSDSNARGFLQIGGSHSLEKFANEAGLDVEDPETRLSVVRRLRLKQLSDATGEMRKELKARANLRIQALGSGSDYTPFLQHLGVASLNIGFGNEDPGGGQYHSVYDDFYWYTHFQDRGFAYGRALAQLGGTMMIRLADGDVLPFEFTSLAETLHGYLKEVESLADQQRSAAREHNADLAEGVYQAASDPTLHQVIPAAEPIPPALNFAPLENAIESLTQAAANFEKRASALSPEVNSKLIAAERLQTDNAGLPNRPWYRNLVYAPGFYTGYGVKTIPGVREAIEQKRWNEVDTQIARLAGALTKEADLIESLSQTSTGSKSAAETR